MEPSDKDLLLACRQGDQTAWEKLVLRYQRLIYAIPRRAGLDNEDAAEVFQEVFITLFQKLDDINEPERLHAWLVTTARRKTWRIVQKTASRIVVGNVENTDSNDELNNIPDDAPLADAALVELEEQHRVRVALAALDGRCRQLLTMLFYSAEPPSYAEVAESLGIREGGIGPTRARCLEKLLKSLESGGHVFFPSSNAL